MTAGHLESRSRAGAAALKRQFPSLHEDMILVQAGTGFDARGLLDEASEAIPLTDILPGPDSPSPAGHALDLQAGRCESQPLLLIRGRRHLYEGLGMDDCVLPVAAAVRAGLRRIVQISAVGSVRSELKPGTVLAVTDTINNMGSSPLVGNQSLLPAPFPDMTEIFSQQLTGEFVNAAGRVGLIPRLGVYQANLGPQFETPAEVEVARRNGADVVGMSIVPEATLAQALGAQVLAIAIVANQAAGCGGSDVSHEDIVETVGYASAEVVRALRMLFRALRDETELPPVHALPCA